MKIISDLWLKKSSNIDLTGTSLCLWYCLVAVRCEGRARVRALQTLGTAALKDPDILFAVRIVTDVMTRDQKTHIVLCDLAFVADETALNIREHRETSRKMAMFLLLRP